jgi:hypothetical protein
VADAATYTAERAYWVARLGITDDTDISLSDLQNMARNQTRNVKPLGPNVAQPAVPASTVAQANNLGVDCQVYITGGTVTAVTIDGTATGLTSGTFHVGSGQSISITYSVAPTWKWFGK